MALSRQGKRRNSLKDLRLGLEHTKGGHITGEFFWFFGGLFLANPLPSLFETSQIWESAKGMWGGKGHREHVLQKMFVDPSQEFVLLKNRLLNRKQEKLTQSSRTIRVWKTYQTIGGGGQKPVLGVFLTTVFVATFWGQGLPRLRVMDVCTEMLVFWDFEGMIEIFGPGRQPRCPPGSSQDIWPLNLLSGLAFSVKVQNVL